jgi:hypothetical protein
MWNSMLIICFCAKRKCPTLCELQYRISCELRYTATPAYKSSFSNCQNRFLSFDASLNGAKTTAQNPQNHFWQRHIFYIRTSLYEFNKIYILFLMWLVQGKKSLLLMFGSKDEMNKNMMHHFMCSCFSFKISYGWNL